MTSNRSTSMQLDKKIHGLPGLGIAGPDGSTGQKGHSSYVGYLTEFFNVEYYLDPSYAYIRTKNEPSPLSLPDHNEIDNEVYGHERDNIHLEKHMLYNIQQGPGGSAPDAYFMYTGFEDNFFKFVRGDRGRIGEYHIHNAYDTADTSILIGAKQALEFTDADGNQLFIDPSGNIVPPNRKYITISGQWIVRSAYVVDDYNPRNNGTELNGNRILPFFCGNEGPYSPDAASIKLEFLPNGSGWYHLKNGQTSEKRPLYWSVSDDFTKLTLGIDYPSEYRFEGDGYPDRVFITIYDIEFNSEDTGINGILYSIFGKVIKFENYHENGDPLKVKWGFYGLFDDGCFIKDITDEILSPASATTSGSISIGRIRLPDDDEWRFRQSLMRPHFAKYMTSDVAVPVSLKDEYMPGDLLYILDNETDRIKYIVRVDDDMRGCTFERFLQQDMNEFGSILNDFRLEGDRVMLNADGFTAASMRTSGNGVSVPGGMGFLQNLINMEEDAGMLSVITNSRDGSVLMTGLTGGGRTLSVNIGGNGFTLSSQDPLRLSSLSMKNGWTNINVPEYNDDAIRLPDGLRCPGVTSSDIYQENIGETSDVSVYVSMKYTKFYRSASPGRYFGIRIYTADDCGRFSAGVPLIERIAENGGQITFDLTAMLKELTDPGDGTADYFIYTFVKGGASMTRYSAMSRLRIEWRNGTAVSRTLLDGDVSDPEPSPYMTSGHAEFIMDTVECGACTGNLTVRPLGNDRIVSISINSQMLCRNDGGSFRITPWPYEGWCTVRPDDITVTDGKVSMNIGFLSNLPPVNVDTGGVTPDTVAEWFSAVQAASYDTSYSIGDLITGTGDRAVTVTAVTEDTVTSECYTSVYRIVQPGFASALPDISVGFTPLIRNGMIERSNRRDNGVLCNQVQFFTECGIYGFTEEAWGKWFTDLTLSVELDIDKEVYRTYDDYKFTTTVNPGNIQPYDADQTGMYGNNAVRTRFSWITPSSGLTYESSVHDIEESDLHEIVIPSSADKNPDGWIVLSPDGRRKTGSVLYEGINYNIGTGAGINGLTLRECAKGPVLLRILTEFANPVPAEMNFAWRAVRISVSGRLKDEFGGSEMMTFSKACSYESENVKFIVNPISMTLAPLSEDGSLGKIRNSAGYIKFTGPEDEIKISTALVRLTGALRSEYENGSPVSEGVPYTAFQRIMHSIPDVSAYEPRLKYLQDGVTSIVIEPLDTRSLIKSGTLTPGNSEFIRFYAGEMLDMTDSSTVQYREFLAGRYNIQDFNVNPDINQSFGDRFVSLFYNTDYLNPVMRSGTLSFYYNGDAYPASKYTQESKKDGGIHQPLLIRQAVSVPLRTREEYEAIKIWNREYESSERYNEKVPFGGDLTQSGNGYMFCPESADGGQWESEHIMPLADLKESQNRTVLAEPVTGIISEAEGFQDCPEAGKYFRSLVWSLGWTYPNFVEENNVTFIIPFYVCNPYESCIDVSVMKTYRSVFDPQDYEEDFVRWTDEQTRNGNIPEIFRDIKIRRLTESGDTVIRQLIPYNLMYGLSPRTAYNTDMNGTTVNVFMLQQPTIMDDTTYEFRDKADGVDKAVRLPLSPESFDTYKDFIYTIDRPWSFGG